MRSVLVFAAVIAFAGVVSFAQQHPPHAPGSPQRPPAAPLPDLKATPLAKFIGTWEGESKTSMPGPPGSAPQSHVAKAVEKAQWKLGGSAIMVEGHGTIKDPATGQERTVHDALGLMRFDPRTRSLRFIGFRANEPTVDAELQVLENGDLRWAMEPAPGRSVRFTITLTDDTWKEVGEFSPDGGATWHKMLEMNLKRVAKE